MTSKRSGRKTAPGSDTKAGEILNVAERLARTHGYNGFSFRNIAAEVGIKSASVHYHFPTKADLGTTLARRYAERFFKELGDPADPAASPRDSLERYVAVFRRALVADGQMCLCGMLGAEVAALPDAVAAEVRGFFEGNVAWLEAVLSRIPAESAGCQAALRQRALMILAALEGAMIVARTLGRNDVFDRIMAGAIRTRPSID